MAVIPFSTPANISTYDRERPGLGEQLAWKVHAELLKTGQIPIVEILNRQDWPGKKEEFFSGNFGAIAFARDADYDFVFIGRLEPIRNTDTLEISTKLIETDSGITVWYGKSSAYTNRRTIQQAASALWIEDRRPDLIYSDILIDELSRCIVRGALEEQPTP